MLGYARDELIGLHASAVVAGSETAYVEPARRTITATSGDHRAWQCRRKDGSLFGADVIASTMPDGNVPAVTRDVTERDQAVDALRATEERTRFALHHANVGIWDMDFTSGVLHWSETIEAQYGLPPGSFAGTSRPSWPACIPTTGRHAGDGRNRDDGRSRFYEGASDIVA